MHVKKLVFALAIALALTNCQSESKQNQTLPPGKNDNKPLTNLVAEIQRRDSLLAEGKKLDAQLRQEIETNRKLKEALRNLERIENETHQISKDTSTRFRIESGGWEILGGRSYTYWNGPCCCPRFESGIYPTPGGSRGLSIAPGETITIGLGGIIFSKDTMPADTTQHEN